MVFFRKPKEKINDFSGLAVDFHNHVIPGIDDGSPSMEESTKMLKQYVDLGYKKVIASPHVITALYPNSKDIILGQMYHMQEVIKENNIPLELEATGEYQLDFEFRDRMEKGDLLPFGKENFIMVELPFQKPVFSIEEIIFDILAAGYIPILAHPERYPYLYSDFEKYKNLKNRGLLFQLNANSLNGLYYSSVKKVAEKLVKSNMIDFICSDAHHASHLQQMRKTLSNTHFISLMSNGAVRNAELL